MSSTKKQLQYGASGDEVKELQTLLNNNGYKLDVDGIFGSNTQKAVREYQQKFGLDVDGIVGNNTWGKLLGSSGSTSSSKASSGFEYDPFEYASYKEGDSVTAAGKKKDDAESALKNYGDFSYSNQSTLDDVINKILNREKFSYDLNGDALYQQYKDKYIQQGKLAMQDTMGQAAAMTGGYGSSYATTAGNQAYQASLEKLNDIIPELQQMAYDRYAQEGQDMLNQYSILSDDRNTQYGLWNDGYNRLATDRDYYSNQYDSERNYDYSKFANDRSFEYGKYSDDRNLAYSTHRDKIEDEQWQKNFDEAVRQAGVQEEQWQKQFDAVYGQAAIDANTKSYSGTTSSGSNYNNGSLTTAQIKALQAAIGAEVDGYYGDESKAKAGGLSAAEAYAKFVGGDIDDDGGNSKISSIRTKAATFTNNDALNNYLTQQYNAGNISEEEMGELYLEFEVSSLQNRNWTLSDGGGINWFGGIDNNAKVKDQYGNSYTLNKLVDALVAEGMSKSKAKDYVKKLQNQLGA